MPGLRWLHIKLDLNEDLPKYWDVLDEKDKNWLFAEEHNMRENYKVKIMSDDEFAELKKRLPDKHSASKKLTGVQNYDILANPLYAYQFNYFSAAQIDPPRSVFINDGDANEENDNLFMDRVRLALNLGFIDTNQTYQSLVDAELKRAEAVSQRTKTK